MEFKGTKRNWNLVKSLSNPAYNVTGTNLGGKFKIARCPYFVNPHSEELTFKDEQESKHNALLISKAPELLECLIELLSHYEDVVKGDFSPFALRSVIDQTKELIKQATEL